MDKPRGSFEKMAENIVDPLMQPEIILTENDVPGGKLTKNLAECNVDKLKRWLECGGQKKGGRKAELVARVEGLLKLNLPIDSKIDNGLWYKQKEQKNSHVMQDFIEIRILAMAGEISHQEIYLKISIMVIYTITLLNQ